MAKALASHDRRTGLSGQGLLRADRWSVPAQRFQPFRIVAGVDLSASQPLSQDVLGVATSGGWGRRAGPAAADERDSCPGEHGPTTTPPFPVGWMIPMTFAFWHQSRRSRRVDRSSRFDLLSFA